MPLKVSLRTARPLEASAPVKIIGVFAFSEGKASGKHSAVPPSITAIDSLLGGGLLAVVAREEFSGKRDQTLSVTALGSKAGEKVVLLGLGPEGELKACDVRAFAGRAAKIANTEKSKSLALSLPDGALAHARELGEGLELGAYRFTKYMTGDRKPKVDLADVVVTTSEKVPAAAKAALELGLAIGRAVNLSRDVSNEPPNTIYPESMAKEAERVAKANKLKVTVFDHKEILRRGMHLIDAVGRGSVRTPRVVHLSYVPTGKAKKRIVFVGKGITFDTGGISIKPSAGMEEMKHDMSGAGNMIGLMAAVAALKPSVEVHAFMGCAENMPDGNAYRPGDIWPSYDGKTVEIVNTDAEGRLVLADVLAYARELKPDLLIDNATLTGACVVALGKACSGFYATNDETADDYASAAKEVGEQVWRMPLLEDLRDQIKSDVADVKQSGERWGGSITAALFLREFIGDTKNWVHADIAGPAATDKTSGWTQARGATGHGVLTFLKIVERASSAK